MSSDAKVSFTKHSIPRVLVDREVYILQNCSGKRVLHIGCINYASFENWVESRGSLHKRIEQVATELVGIDNAAEAVELARSRYGMRNIHVADAQHLETLKKGTFDVVVAGEVLEHLPSPGSFLNSVHTVLKQDGSLIVTTTNAFCLRRFLGIPFGKESVHVDHLAYFSHRTLQRLAEVCGYSVVEQCAYRIPNKRPILPYLAERLACIISPNLCEGIICCMKSSRQNKNEPVK